MFSLWNLTQIFQPVVKRFKIAIARNFRKWRKKKRFFGPRIWATEGHLPAFSVPRVGHLQTFLLARGQAFANPGAIPEFLTCTVSFQNITTQTKSRLGHLSRTGGLSRHVNQGSKLKKSSSRLLTTNCRNIVARCKFLVGSLYNVNDTAH